MSSLPAIIFVFASTADLWIEPAVDNYFFCLILNKIIEIKID